MAHAQKRLAGLHARGIDEAYLYGMTEKEQPGTQGLNAFFLLLDRPEAYNLPPRPAVPTKSCGASWGAMALAALGMTAAALFAVRWGGKRS